MTDEKLYRAHLENLDAWLADAIKTSGLPLDGVLFHAGRQDYFHADDEARIFRPTPHFSRYVPLDSPEHVVLARPGNKPIVVHVKPKDYWYDTAPLEPSYWQAHVDLKEVAHFDEISGVLGSLERIAFVGHPPKAAAQLGIDADLVEPAALMAPLDWHRAVKTEHEIELLKIACERGAEGHRVARKAFEAGLSEREIYWAYVQGTGHVEKELAFAAIVARGDKPSVLHYQFKRGRIDGLAPSCLIDAGASFDGYRSDITRTWYLDDADETYKLIVDMVDALERDLVAMVEPERSYVDIHVEAHRRIADVLVEAKLVTCDRDEAFDKGITRPFLPHGVGHHLGIQVHDVGGHQAAKSGGKTPPPAEYPALRNTRTMQAGHVLTIEPGLYFIPMLLDELRGKPEGKLVDWGHVERMLPYGGVRIEDDIVCRDGEPEDLTRPLIQGPRGV